MKRKVNSILLIWGIVSFAAISYIFFQGIRIEKKHVSIIELAEDVKSEFFQSQIEREHFLLTGDTLSFRMLIAHLDLAANDLKKIIDISGIQLDKAKPEQPNGFVLRIPMMMEYLNQIKNLYQSHQLNISDTSSATQNEAFINYNLKFKEFENGLQRYLSNRNRVHKRASFALIIISFIVLISSFLYISKLLKTLAATERKLIESTVEIEQKERHRFATDLHDGLGSLLSSVNLYLKILEAEVQEGKDVSERIVHLKQLSDLSLQSAEAVINNLEPLFLSKYGLIVSLNRMCQRMNKLDQIQFDFNTDDFNLLLSKSTELILYRIFSELFNNAVKHSKATTVWMSLRNVKQNVYIRYTDNGIGFDHNQIQFQDETKLGIKSIISRIESLGGTYQINSKPGSGFEMALMFHAGKPSI